MTATPAERGELQFKPSELDTSVRYDSPSTPSSHGTAARKRQEGDTDRDEKYRRIDYDEYIREDLHSRVFVDFEAFIKSALHVPHDWRTLWGPAIKAVKEDKSFKEFHRKYCEQCDRPGPHEVDFYDPLVDTANSVLKVVYPSKFEGISGTPQYYRVNNPKRIWGGVMDKFKLSPDLVVVHKDLRPPVGKSLHWANPLHVLEVKPYDGAICDGTKIPRLIVDGKPVTSPIRGWQ